jgi:hypothetical protein
MFRIPYFYPAFTAGNQIQNFGSGGPASHMALQAMQPRSYPTLYNVGAYGVGNMPRQIIGPTLPITVNALSNPLVFNQLEIPGISKSGRG